MAPKAFNILKGLCSCRENSNMGRHGSFLKSYSKSKVSWFSIVLNWSEKFECRTKQFFGTTLFLIRRYSLSLILSTNDGTS